MTEENEETSLWNKIRYHTTYYPYLYYCQLESKMMSQTTDSFGATKILDNLYLGSLPDSTNFMELKNHKITHILTVILGTTPMFPEEFQYLNIPALDMDGENLINYFEKCILFIEEGIKKGGVLVHCRKGRSRSSTIVIAYLIKTQKMSLKDALKFVQQKREIVQPNDDFMKQLEKYQNLLLSK